MEEQYEPISINEAMGVPDEQAAEMIQVIQDVWNIIPDGEGVPESEVIKEVMARLGVTDPYPVLLGMSIDYRRWVTRIPQDLKLPEDIEAAFEDPYDDSNPPF